MNNIQKWANDNLVRNKEDLLKIKFKPVHPKFDKDDMQQSSFALEMSLGAIQNRTQGAIDAMIANWLKNGTTEYLFIWNVCYVDANPTTSLTGTIYSQEIDYFPDELNNIYKNSFAKVIAKEISKKYTTGAEIQYIQRSKISKSEMKRLINEIDKLESELLPELKDDENE